MADRKGAASGFAKKATTSLPTVKRLQALANRRGLPGIVVLRFYPRRQYVYLYPPDSDEPEKSLGSTVETAKRLLHGIPMPDGFEPVSSIDYYRAAAEKGYTVTTAGEVLSPRGRMLSLMLNNKGYPRFSFWFQGQIRKVFVHRFAAFLKFGEAALVKGIHVRHLDDERLNGSHENLDLGSQSDNERDKAAGAAAGITSEGTEES